MAHPTGSEGAAPSNPSGSPQPSEPEISQLRQRIDRLQQVQQLTEQISVLEESIGLDAARHPKRRRDDSDSDRDGRDVNLERAIGTFTLRFTYRQRDEWLADLRRAFDSAPGKYRKPRRCINLAVSKMDSQCRPLWDRKVQRAYAEDPANAARIQADWDTFSQWTASLIRDAGHHEAAVAELVEDAAQGSSQHPRDFDNYLQSLEDQDPERKAQPASARFYYAKLTRPLRNKLKEQVATLPRTREGMVSLATRHWELLDAGSETNGGRTDPETVTNGHFVHFDDLGVTLESGDLREGTRNPRIQAPDYRARPAKRQPKDNGLAKQTIQAKEPKPSDQPKEAPSNLLRDPKLPAPHSDGIRYGRDGEAKPCLGCGSLYHWRSECPERQNGQKKNGNGKQ
ncbi:hypothetical protein F4780DRAFT_777494 [Xylariomycetidae sp. FL0641]|nr:hypothetical protein F4780DRAFT_777494 [Xylariomycetidae sp. FL0641]